MDQSSISQNRRSRRSNVLLAASIEVSGAVVPVKLRNLSTEGALIEGDGLPVEGSEVMFRRNEISVSSRVAWVHGKQAGVAFRRPIHQEEVLRNIPKPRYRAQPEFRRPALACRQLTAEERRLAQSWAWTPWGDSLGE
ncbi:MAG TPA: PilZ domain-containing protein [Sphingomicrobium sp.]|nr:PilZ domain-containing protein [Sphingomicrobium sp.]